ncbi:MAG: hypothetical protein HOO88_00445 [Kiritimatiellaceae bacterium]|nr:hypothetical protein [Kiritimatiellaceae bacterium]
MATLGQKLKAAREAKGVSEHDAGIATKILTKMIAAMEADDFSLMAAPTYAKGFIRIYAGYLGLNPDPLIEEYITRHAPKPKPLIDEESQLEKNRQRSSAFSFKLKWLPAKLNPLVWLSAPFKKFLPGLKPYVAKDIRALAIGIAGLIILIILIVSVSSCVRRHLAAKPAVPVVQTKAARKLLDEPLPDLYLVEPGKIESSR